MGVNIGELLYALFGMGCGVIMTLGVIWTLEPEKFWELMRPKRKAK